MKTKTNKPISVKGDTKPALCWVCFLLFIAAAHLVIIREWSDVDAFLFALFSSAGKSFSILLLLLFVIGWFILTDRLLFWLLYGFLGKRFDPGVHGDNNFYRELEKEAKLYLKTRDAISEDLESRLKQKVRDSTLDGQNFHGGDTALQILGVLAPTIGFMGTLTGLIASFRELGAGAELSSVLGGLGIAMSTSLIGAALYVLFTAGQTLNSTMAHAVETRIDSILSSLEIDRGQNHPQQKQNPIGKR